MKISTKEILIYLCLLVLQILWCLFLFYFIGKPVFLFLKALKHYNMIKEFLFIMFIAITLFFIARPKAN